MTTPATDVYRLAKKKLYELEDAELNDVLLYTEQGYNVGLTTYSYALRRVVDKIVTEGFMNKEPPMKILVVLFRIYLLQSLTMMYRRLSR